ncbi:MAG: hypothetical protein NTV32_01685 [Gammaproteobacteria bacterium]|nr:hypothetical protein [Gammaproteobacteria bacterium]
MRIALFFCAVLFSTYGYAVRSCGISSGIYAGTYQDKTGLFLPQAFPLKLYLTERAGKIYGYTLKSDDSKGAAYGQSPYAFFWMTCQDHTIHQIYMIKNTERPCGVSTSNLGTIQHFQVMYENAMISASLSVNLAFVGPSPLINKKLLKQAKHLAEIGVNTCA